MIRILKLQFLVISILLNFSCTDFNMLKQVAATPTTETVKTSPTNPSAGNEPAPPNGGGGGSSGYEYKGSCVHKIKIARSSTLAPEIKDGDLACVEYSPKDYQGAGSTGATVVIISATWCGPCTKFKSKYSELLDLAERHKATVKIILERNANPSTVKTYGLPEFFMSNDIETFEQKYGRISSFPTILIINNKGVKVATTYADIAMISAELDKL